MTRLWIGNEGFNFKLLYSLQILSKRIFMKTDHGIPRHICQVLLPTLLVEKWDKYSSGAFSTKITLILGQTLPGSVDPDWMLQNAVSHQCLLCVCYSSSNILNRYVTKTHLFKYVENFTTKNWKFSDKNSDIFHISDQNIDHNLWFLQK